MSTPEWSGRLEDPVPVGARVKLTGVFLKNTGQRLGGEGERVWTRVDCECEVCARGGHVAVDEYPIERLLADLKRARRRREREVVEHLLSNYTDAEKASPRTYPRHIAVGALMPEHPRTPRARYYP